MIDSQKIDEAVRMFSGIPYRHGGRSKDGLDCLGLVYVFYKQLGIDLPDNDGSPYPPDWYKKDRMRLYRGVQEIGKPVPVQELAPVDLVFFRIGGFVNHIGVMVSPDSFIHVLKGQRVHVSPLNAFWRRHLMGARRLT